MPVTGTTQVQQYKTETITDEIRPPLLPSRRRRAWRHRPLFWLGTALGLIVLLHALAATHPADPTVVPLDCTGLIHTTDYAQLLHLKPGLQELEAVESVSQLTGGQPAALVEVGNVAGRPSLDMYIYGCATRGAGPQLQPLFVERGLIDGTVTISQANTLITSELDQALLPQARAALQPMQQSIYREYVWHKGTFIQVAFPGMYPVASRGEAELLQQQSDDGQALPWSDPRVTAQQMAQDIFKWSNGDIQETLLSTDGISAQVSLVHQNPHLEVTVSLSRLIQRDTTGLWFVTDARSAGIGLDQVHLLPPVPSPLVFEGTGVLADGQATAILFDHTLTPLPTLNSAVLNIDTNGTFTGALPYAGSTPDQQGLLLVQTLPIKNTTETGRMLLASVMLG
ncbi:MAG: hypothetical protein M3Y81_13055 [Chloroflexota bacterium]|nr:hypothetical protein [Chloroflexota bacterium]